ncbi:MAG: M56 family metallopeptidase [Anaerolineae bacterium]|nr:M56 family metallopeptidase [Anaerolineae bacterium]
MIENRPLYNLSTSALLLAIICIGTVSLCGWLVAWCLSGTPFKQIFLVMILLSIGLFTLLRQIRRTQRCIGDLLLSAEAALPEHLQMQIAQRGIDRSNIILVQSAEPLAFCSGFLKPHICLSTGLVDLLSPAQLQAVLLHEDYHRQRFDPLRILVVRAISAALFFLPFVREWRRLFEIKLELEADRYAVSLSSKVALAGALHQLLNYSPSRLSISEAGIITAGLSANTARIAALLGERANPEQISRKSVISSTAILWVICFILMM